MRAQSICATPRPAIAIARLSAHHTPLGSGKPAFGQVPRTIWALRTKCTAGLCCFAATQLFCGGRRGWRSGWRHIPLGAWAELTVSVAIALLRRPVLHW